MAEHEAVDLDPKYREIVVELLREHVPGCEVRAYGSRVKWKARQHSDLDLAVMETRSVGPAALPALREALEESDLPFRVDVLDWDTIPSDFRSEIERRHVVLQPSAPNGRWRSVALGDVATMNDDQITKDHDLAFLSYLDTGNITDGRVERYQHLVPGRDKIPSRARRQCRPGDIVYSTVRPNQRHYGILHEMPENAVVSTGFTVIRADEQNAHNEYLYWYLAQDHIVALLQAIAEHSTSAYPSIKASDLERLMLLLPPIDEQRQTASVLRKLDDRIELHRRMCETLEEMAQALFKSWFVDFDPVRAKMDGRWHEGESLPGLPAHLYDYFPDDLVDSELGPIPAGWCIGPLSEAIEVNPNTKSDQSEQHRYVAMASIPTDGPFVRERVFRDKATGCRYRNGDALVARITPCLENGKTAYVDFLDHDEVGCGSTELLVLRARAPWPPESSYLLARQQHFRDYAVANMVGSSGRQRVSAEVIGQFRTVLPPDRLMSAVASTLTSVFRRGSEAVSQSVRLTNLRDTMLPKLISGEIRLPTPDGEPSV